MTQTHPSELIDRDKADELAERLDVHGIPRRTFLKVLGASMATAGIGSLLSACGSTAGSSTGSAGASVGAAGNDKITIITFSLVGDYSTEWNEGATGAAQQLGIPHASYNGKGDASTQQNEFNTALTQGSKGVYMMPVDGGIVPTLATQANQNQIYYCNAWSTQAWYTPWDSGPYYTEFVIDDEPTCVAATCELLFKAMGEEGTVVRIGGTPNDSTELLRRAGFERALKKFPKIKFAGMLYGDYEPEASKQAMASLLSKYPEATGVVAINDDAATGAVAAIEAAGKTPGKDIFITGTNGSVEGVERVAKGTQLCTTGNVPSYPSYQMTVNIYDHLHGWKPNEAERLFGWNAEILTKENVTPYLDRYVKGPISKQFSAKLLSRTLSPSDWDMQFEAFPWEDLDELFINQPKPSGYKYPAAYLKAKEDGSFEEIRKLWKEHYKTPVMGPSPIK